MSLTNEILRKNWATKYVPVKYYHTFYKVLRQWDLENPDRAGIAEDYVLKAILDHAIKVQENK